MSDHKIPYLQCEKCKHDIYNGKCINCNNYIEYVEHINDNINPSHYTKFKIPPNVYITKNNLNWEQGNVIKYITRYADKNGKEDLLKAIKYIEMLIEREYEQDNNTTHR